METVTKPKKEKKVNKKKSVKEYNNSLQAIMVWAKSVGLKISCDDAIFNLGPAK